MRSDVSKSIDPGSQVESAAIDTQNGFPGTDAFDYGQLMQSLPAAVYTCDKDGRITMFNEAAADLWGRRPELGNDLWCGSWKIFKSDGSPLPLDECPMAIALREARPVRGETILIERPDGKRVWVLPHPDPIFDASGSLAGARNLLVDISDLQLQKETVRRKQEQLDLVTAHAPVNIAHCDREARYLFVNRPYAQRFGMEPGDLVGHRIAEILGTEAYAAIEPFVTRALAGELVQFETEIPYAGIGPRWMFVRYSPDIDSSGAVRGLVCAATDITDLRLTQEKLRDSDARLGRLLSLMPAAVYTCDREGRIDFYNDRALEIWGRAPESGEAGDRYCAAFKCWINGAVVPSEETPVMRAATEGKSFRNLEPVFERPDGRKISVLVNIDPLFDEQGCPTGAVVVVQDISGTKAIEQKLRERTRSLEALNRIGNALAGELDSEKLVQAITDAGREVTGAEFGAFFYNTTDEHGERYALYTLAGAPREAFAKLPMPRKTAVFGPTFEGEGIIRSGDILKDPRNGAARPRCQR